MNPPNFAPIPPPPHSIKKQSNEEQAQMILAVLFTCTLLFSMTGAIFSYRAASVATQAKEQATAALQASKEPSRVIVAARSPDGRVGTLPLEDVLQEFLNLLQASTTTTAQ